MNFGRMKSMSVFTNKGNASGVARTPKRKSSLYGKENMSLLSMCLLPAALLIVFCYIPMFGIILAFKDYRYDLGIFGSAWNGLKNFDFLFKSGSLAMLVRNTVGLNLLFIVVTTIVNVFVALMMYEVTSRVKIKVYQTLTLLPHFISWVIVGYMVYALFNPAYGVINSILGLCGAEPISWYAESKYWPTILLLCNVWKGTGYGCIIYYAALMGLDPTYFEAAELDGATKWQVRWHIIIPSLRTIIIINTILAVGSIMRADFGLFYQIPRNQGALYATTDVIDTFIYRALKVDNNVSVSTAVGLFQSVVNVILITITNAIVRKIEPESALF